MNYTIVMYLLIRTKFCKTITVSVAAVLLLLLDFKANKYVDLHLRTDGYMHLFSCFSIKNPLLKFRALHTATQHSVDHPV